MKGVQKSLAPLEPLWLVVAIRMGAVLALPVWLPGSFLVVSGARITGDQAAGGLGRFRVPWGLQHCGHEREGRLPEKEACPPVTQVSLGATRMVYNGLPRVLVTPTGAVTGSGAQAATLVVVVGGTRELLEGCLPCS